MEPRMRNPAVVLPDTMAALMDLGKSTKKSGLAPETATLVHIRASQINGCGLCLEMHMTEAKKAGESEERLFTVAAWRDAPYFSDAERAALELTEAVTRLADRPEAVSDEIWEKAATHYDEEALAALIVEIGLINLWNRLNATTRQRAGQWAG